jgi:hypothetical protein
MLPGIMLGLKVNLSSSESTWLKSPIQSHLWLIQVPMPRSSSQTFFLVNQNRVIIDEGESKDVSNRIHYFCVYEVLVFQTNLESEL